MIISREDEEKVCCFLKSAVEEWGPENVTVYLPESWRNPRYSLGLTKLDYHNQQEVKVVVTYNSMERLSFSVPISVPIN